MTWPSLHSDCRFHHCHHELVRAFPGFLPFIRQRIHSWTLILPLCKTVPAPWPENCIFLSSSFPALTSPTHLLEKEINELLIAIPHTQQIAMKFHLCLVFLKDSTIKQCTGSGPLWPSNKKFLWAWNHSVWKKPVSEIKDKRHYSTSLGNQGQNVLKEEQWHLLPDLKPTAE